MPTPPGETEAEVDPAVPPEDEARARRRRAVRETAGWATGMYPPGYLEDLRAEWPE